MKKFFFIFVMAFCLAGRALCFPALTGRVVDEAHILSQGTQYQLTQLLQSEPQHQVVVVTLSDLEGKSIEDYGYQLGRYWGIGEKGHDNGVLLIIVPQEKQVRIEVGYGLESALTDAVASVILNNMMPALQKGDYNQAALIGTQQILDTIRPETFSQETEKESTTLATFVLACLVIGLFIYVAMAPKKDRAKRLRLILTLIALMPGRGAPGFKGKGGRFGGGGASKRF